MKHYNSQTRDIYNDILRILAKMDKYHKISESQSIKRNLKAIASDLNNICIQEATGAFIPEQKEENRIFIF